MSIEIYCLSDSPLSSISEWQQFIDALGFPLRFSSDVPFDKVGGSIVAQLRGNRTSLEYRFEDPKQLMNFYSNVNFGHDWKYNLTLPWISGFDGLDVAWMAAASYAHATDGIVFDPQEGKVFNSEEALHVIRDMERDAPQAKTALQDFLRQLSAKP